MFPVALDATKLDIVLVGQGEALDQRLGLLKASGAPRLTVYGSGTSWDGVAFAGDLPSEAEIAAAHILFVAGLEPAVSEKLAAWARVHGTLVNVEDVKPLCDFHIPSMVRRGDLLLTVSTGGKSPGLARRLRQHLEQRFGPEWAERLEELAAKREAWRAEGLALKEVGRRVVRYIDEKGWLS